MFVKYRHASRLVSVAQMEDWPFESFAAQLMSDLLHPAWERRHGAAIGLRHLIRVHGKGAGTTVDTPTDQVLHCCDKSCKLALSAEIKMLGALRLLIDSSSKWESSWVEKTILLKIFVCDSWTR